jgi:hypothetical protein
MHRWQVDERWVFGTLANCSVTWGKGGLEGFIDKMLAVVLFTSLYMDMDPILAV